MVNSDDTQTLQKENENLINNQTPMDDDVRDALLNTNNNSSNLDSFNIVSTNNNISSMNNNLLGTNSFNYSGAVQETSTQYKKRFGKVSSSTTAMNRINDNFGILNQKKKQSKSLSLLTFSYIQIIFFISDFIYLNFLS